MRKNKITKKEHRFIVVVKSDGSRRSVESAILAAFGFRRLDCCQFRLLRKSTTTKNEPALVKALSNVRRKWTAQTRTYRSEAMKYRMLEPMAACRYEGEAIAFRWCNEDLELLLKKHRKGKRA